MTTKQTNGHQKRSKTAIEGERGTVFRLLPTEVRIVGFDTKHKTGEHPLWQARALEPVDEAFAQNMAQVGFTSIIDVRKDGPHLEVVVGRRRVKAARRANEIRESLGLEPLKISVQVTRGDNLSMVGRMISENALRKDVHPLDMAADLQAYLNMGASDETAARSCGKTVQQLRQTLKLLDLDVDVQDAIRTDKISTTAGIHLADLSREDQKIELTKMLEGQTDNTAAAVASAVKARKTGEEAVQAPGKRLLTKLIEHEDAEMVFGTEGIRALRYAMGEISPRQLRGLTDLIREVSGK